MLIEYGVDWASFLESKSIQGTFYIEKSLKKSLRELNEVIFINRVFCHRALCTLNLEILLIRIGKTFEYLNIDIYFH